MAYFRRQHADCVGLTLCVPRHRRGRDYPAREWGSDTDGVDYSLPGAAAALDGTAVKLEDPTTYVQETTRANLHFQFDAPYNK